MTSIYRKRHFNSHELTLFPLRDFKSMTWGLCVMNIFPALPQTNRRLNIASSFLPWHVPPSIFMTFSVPSLCISRLSFICRDVDNGADMRAEPGRPCLWDSCLHTGRAAAAGCHFQRPPGTPSPRWHGRMRSRVDATVRAAAFHLCNQSHQVTHRAAALPGKCPHIENGPTMFFFCCH